MPRVARVKSSSGAYFDKTFYWEICEVGNQKYTQHRHGELETILNLKKVGKKLNIVYYRIKYFLQNAVEMEIQLAYLKYLAVFGLFAFIWTHSRPLTRKFFSKYGFLSKIYTPMFLSEKIIKFTCNKNMNGYAKYD